MVQNEVKGEGLRGMLKSGMPMLLQLILERNNNPEFINIILSYPNRLRLLYGNDVDIYGVDEDLNPASSRLIEILFLKLDGLTVEDYVHLGRLEFPRVRYCEVLLKNIYDCEALKELLGVVRRAHKLGIQISNDYHGLNSSCLEGYPAYSSEAETFSLYDEFGTTNIPHFMQLVTNSTR